MRCTYPKKYVYIRITATKIAFANNDNILFFIVVTINDTEQVVPKTVALVTLVFTITKDGNMKKM